MTGPRKIALVRPDSEIEMRKIANAVADSGNIVVVTGAGISTSAGIPDFRSKDGLYTTASPFRQRSKARGRQLFHMTALSHPVDGPALIKFCTELRRTARSSEATDTHRFIADLSESGKLVRNYTQNIDDIEETAGLCTDLQRGPGNRLQSGADGGKQTGRQSNGSGRFAGCWDRGLDCVQLHGSLRLLRCSVCGRRCSWDDDERETVTLPGQLPTCPFCAEASEARLAAGRRKLNPGQLRPDILLYGEVDRSDLIPQIMQHDLSLDVDLLLIFGTSLSVDGIEQMTRNFAEIVHKNGGMVVFVNRTEAAKSVWNGVIDYWVRWDCDAWVRDLKKRKPGVWLSSGTEETSPSTGTSRLPSPASGTAAKKRRAPAPATPRKRAKIHQSPRNPAGTVRNMTQEWEPAGTLDDPIDLTDDDDELVSGAQPGSTAENPIGIGPLR